MKKSFLSLIICIISFQLCLAQQFETFFTEGSLRIDYMHTVNAQDELISLDEFYHEPYWGGSRINLIDTFNYGYYKIDVLDSATNRLIYSRGYSSLSGEWRSTPEARTNWRSFSETLIIPYPKETVKVNFYERAKDQQWKFLTQFLIDPNDYNIIPQLKNPITALKINYVGSSDKKLDLVLLAEGYSKSEQDKFVKDAKRFSEYLFGCTPFNKYHNDINIWAIPSISNESGTDIPGNGIYKNTAFDSHFYTFGSERYLNTESNKVIRDAAANAPYDQIYILVNSAKYGGAGIYNYYSICTSDNKNSDFVFTHEFGHAFAGLADEYYTSDVGVENFYDVNYEPWEPNITSLKNFESKWKRLLTLYTPIPTIEDDLNKYSIGVYEGAGYLAKGLFRPRYDCSMKSVKYNDFCPVCINAIEKRLNFYIH